MIKRKTKIVGNDDLTGATSDLIENEMGRGRLKEDSKDLRVFFFGRNDCRAGARLFYNFLGVDRRACARAGIIQIVGKRC